MAGAALLLLLVLYRLLRAHPLARLIWLPFFLAALGFAAAQFSARRVEAPALARKTYPITITGTVRAVEALPKDMHRITLDSLSCEEQTTSCDEAPSYARVRLKRGSTVPAVGDEVRVKAILLPLSPPVMPGAYDFQRHAYFMKISATGFALSDIEIISTVYKGETFAQLRQYLRAHIESAIGKGDAAAMTIALLYGEDRDISPQTQEDFRAAGIAHLTAISGFQITLIAGFVFFFARAFLALFPYAALHWPIKKIAAAVAMAGTVFYMALIGSSVSAERAVIMTMIVMLAVMLDRDPFTLRLAAASAAFILLLQPESLFGASFQLSFAAVVALIAFYESTSDWWAKGREDRTALKTLGLFIAASLATTLVATLATAPIAFYHFLKAPLLPGLIANLIAVPITSFITMPAAIVSSFLMPLGLEAMPLQLAGWSAELIIKAAHEIAQWPYALLHVDAWPLAAMITIVLGGLWICIWRGKIRWLGLLPVLAALIFIPFTHRADAIVSASGKLFAVRDAQGMLWVSSARTEKFIRDGWIEREGGKGHAFWDDEGSPVTCDREACIFHTKEKTVSFVFAHTALARDCAEADVVISALYVSRHLCEKPILIDRRALKYGGAQSFYIEGDKIVRRSTNGERGQRPWTLPKSRP